MPIPMAPSMALGPASSRSTATVPTSRTQLAWSRLSSLMPHTFPNTGNAAEFVGQTPWSARDALVLRPEQRYQHHANASRPTGASAAVQGDCPTINGGVWLCEKYVALGKIARPTETA